MQFTDYLLAALESRPRDSRGSSTYVYIWWKFVIVIRLHFLRSIKICLYEPCNATDKAHYVLCALQQLYNHID